MQRRPVCFFCAEIIEYDPVFAAPCDHEECASVVFHGICLMGWREHREETIKMVTRWIRDHSGE